MAPLGFSGDGTEMGRVTEKGRERRRKGFRVWVHRKREKRGEWGLLVAGVEVRCCFGVFRGHFLGSLVRFSAGTKREREGGNGEGGGEGDGVVWTGGCGEWRWLQWMLKLKKFL